MRCRELGELALYACEQQDDRSGRALGIIAIFRFQPTAEMTWQPADAGAALIPIPVVDAGFGK